MWFRIALFALLIVSCKNQHHAGAKDVMQSVRSDFHAGGIAFGTLTYTFEVRSVLWSPDMKSTRATLTWTKADKHWVVRGPNGEEIRSGVRDQVTVTWANYSVYAVWRAASDPQLRQPGFVRAGCDVIGKSDGGFIDDSCGTRAASCCNAHDDCYKKNGCTYESWSGQASAACLACNEAVKRCFLDGKGGAPCSEATRYCCNAPAGATKPGDKCENSMWLGGADPERSNNGCPTAFFSPGPAPINY